MIYTFIILAGNLLTSSSEESKINETRKLIEICIIENNKNLNEIKNYSDIYKYLNLNQEEISSSLSQILDKYDKISIKALKIECVPVGLLVHYLPFVNEHKIENLFPTIWERYRHANPYDMILAYNDNQWISADDFLRLGIDSYISKSEGKIKVKIIKSSLDQVIETEFFVFDAILATDPRKEKKLQYGTAVLDGFLVTKVLSDNSEIMPGSFIQPVEIDTETTRCNPIKLLKNLTVYDMLRYIEEIVDSNHNLSIFHLSPVSLHILNNLYHISSEIDSYTRSYIKENSIQAEHIDDIGNLIIDDDQSEYGRLLCQLYNWTSLSAKVNQNILIISPSKKSE